MATENIEFIKNSTVSGYKTADGRLNGIGIKNIKTDSEVTLDVNGLFVSIGRNPATELFRGKFELDASGYIVADETTKTEIEGVFAVGDVRTKALRQVVTAVADGAVAVHFAEEYLTKTR